jgi:polyphenol oxidase
VVQSPSTEGQPLETIEELLQPGEVPLWINPVWQERFPWLVQGTTGAGGDEDPFDLGLFGSAPVGRVMDRWRLVRSMTGMATAVHSRQVHGTEITHWETALPAGMLVVEGFDAHLTAMPNLLLAVSLADCVPVFLVSERPRAVALAHAGWRGAAGGIVEKSVRALIERCGASPGAMWLHCGPAICGRCYEVGPEVHAALWPNAQPPPDPMPVDVRAAILSRAERAGLAPERMSISAHCTRCGPGDFFSHRGGSPSRQMGLVGIRA